jgi:hypothetical protein
MRLIIPLLLCLLIPTALQAAELKSAYTKIEDKSCRIVAEYEAGATSYCEGYGDIWFRIDDGDARISVTYGIDPDEPAETERRFESFGNFNSINDVIEWRYRDGVDGGRPFAAILRWLISVPEPGGDGVERVTGQVLVVSRVGDEVGGKRDLGCVVGYVDALVNPGASQMARDIADSLAADFTCGVDEPAYHGKTGRLSGQPMRSW